MCSRVQWQAALLAVSKSAIHSFGRAAYPASLSGRRLGTRRLGTRRHAQARVGRAVVAPEHEDIPEREREEDRGQRYKREAT